VRQYIPIVVQVFKTVGQIEKNVEVQIVLAVIIAVAGCIAFLLSQ
jgi:hypothetical protein